MNTRPELAHLFIFYVATLVFFAVGAITTPNLGWYNTLDLPGWMLSGLFVACIWGTLILLTALSLILYWDIHKKSPRFKLTAALYAGNALLVLLWNYLFFGVHMLGAAFFVSVLVGLSVVVIIAHVWRISRTSALLLLPYLAWMVFAIYLGHVVSVLNG